MGSNCQHIWLLPDTLEVFHPCQLLFSPFLPGVTETGSPHSSTPWEGNNGRRIGTQSLGPFPLFPTDQQMVIPMPNGFCPKPCHSDEGEVAGIGSKDDSATMTKVRRWWWEGLGGWRGNEWTLYLMKDGSKIKGFGPGWFLALTWCRLAGASTLLHGEPSASPGGTFRVIAGYPSAFSRLSAQVLKHIWIPWWMNLF